MSENIKIEKFLDKITPCIQRGDLNQCIENSIQWAQELGMNSYELLSLASQIDTARGHSYAYVLALTSEHLFEGNEKAIAFYNSGRAAQNLKYMSMAEEKYKRALEVKPKYPEAHLNYAILLKELDRKQEAEVHYKKAIEINPKYAEAHFSYANLLNVLNRKHEAKKQYKNALEANPKYPEAHLNYAILLNDLDRKQEAEEYYKKGLEANPEYAKLHNSYAILLKELDRKQEAEEHYENALEINPKYSIAHLNYAILLGELDRKHEAEIHYEKALEANPKYAIAHSYYAILLIELDRKQEAEEHLEKALEANPKYAEAHSNYANLLKDSDRKQEAEKHYKKAIELDPKNAPAHYNYANMLKKLDKRKEAEEHYKKSLEAEPNHGQTHGAYGLLLIENDKRKEASHETEIASDIFKKTGDITSSYLAKAWFYHKYSEIYIRQKKYRESSEDAKKAGEEYLKAAEYANGNLKEDLMQQGNIQIAKSFIKNIPIKSRSKRIYFRFGKNPDIIHLIENLKNAAVYYEKASFCSINEKQKLCRACHTSIKVFSEILRAMHNYINEDNVEINRKTWENSLNEVNEVYKENDLEKGTTLVKTLKQLLKCVDELAEYQVSGLSVQEDKLGNCYNNLLKVSENLQGPFKVISDHSEEAIKDYAIKHNMNFVKDINIEKKRYSFKNWVEAALLTIILGIIGSIIANRIFELDLDMKLLNLIKSLLKL